MKKASKLLWVLALVLLASVLVIGCDDGSKDPPPVPSVKDWTMAPRGGNTYAAANFTVTETTDGGVKVMKVTWGDIEPWMANDLYAPLPTNVSYQDYDGITFDAKADASNNYLILIRNVGSANAWKIEEQYIEAGAWRTIKLPFSGAQDPAWGTAFTESTLKDWLEATKNSTTVKRVYLAPLLNVGADIPGAVNTLQTVYFKNIGFYKGTAAAPTETKIIWKF